MMAILLSIAGYLLYILCILALWVLVLMALVTASPSFKYLCVSHDYGYIVLPIISIIALALKNFMWVPLISESHYTLPSGLSKVLAVLLCLACYLVCMMIGMVVFYTGGLVCCAALGKTDHNSLSKWRAFIIGSVTLVVMDMLLSYSDMMGTLLPFTALVGLSGMIATPLMAALCRNLGIIRDGEVVTTQALYKFAHMFHDQVQPEVIAALRALFKVNSDEDEALDAALISHGGEAALDHVDEVGTREN